jgi:N-ethylmaleimide reductase
MGDRTLFTPFKLGRIELKNRVVMAPMTRNRAEGHAPGALVAEYYAQRSEAGLIVTEGTSPSPNGLGYPRIPGLFSDPHQQGWRRVAEAVHQAGGSIFVQLMHTGRVGHPLNLPAGARLLGPSAVAAPGEMWTDSQGPQPHPEPEEMTEEDIQAALSEYADAAERAVRVGLDGVELHGANGYLIEQFLNVASNRRTDGWGGTLEGRARFALEAARRTATRIGADRVGLRLSPYGVFNGMQPDAVTDALYEHLAREAARLGLAYLHLVDHSSLGAPKPKQELIRRVRELFSGALILSGGYDAGRAEADLVEGRADLVAFGRPFIANPRLVTRLRAGALLRAPDPATFYTPGPKGYTDYPLD